MYTLNFVESDQYESRVGDLCRELYIPLVLPGRYKSNIEDIENILDAWINLKYNKERLKKKVKEEKKEDKKEEKKKEKESKLIVGEEKKLQETAEKNGKTGKNIKWKINFKDDIKHKDTAKEYVKEKKKETEIEIEAETETNAEKEKVKKETAKKKLKVQDKKKESNKKKHKNKDLYVFSVLFKESLFSLVLCKSKYENPFCAWQTFWCAWIDVFKKSTEQDNEYVKKYKKKIIEFQAGCIYLLFLLYFSQYVKLYQYTYPIYLTPETVDLCLDVIEKCENKNMFTELRFILNFMLDTNSIILSCNERISEIFQDRYGFPLYLEKAKLIDTNSVEINDVHLEKLCNGMMNEMEDLSALCDEQRSERRLSTSSFHSAAEQLGRIKQLLSDI